jgi:sigma-B regulation protein RsbU (phosphoserine phosphatase)
MQANVFQRIQRSLVETRQNLGEWLSGATEAEKEIRLGPAREPDVQAHLQVVDNALAQAGEHKLGLCTVCHGTIDRGLLEMDYTASVCLEHLSKLERDQLQQELDFTQLVQQALLPQEIPQIAGLELAAFSRPAQIVSGDYFDFIHFKDGAPGVVIADAMGHGVSASLIMTSLQTALRTVSPESHSPAGALRRANRYFLHNCHFTTFVSVFLGQYQPASRQLIYCNAGHNPPALYRQNQKRVEWLKPTGAAIGLVEDNPLESTTIQLQSGDILLLYTDGVTEATDERQEAFGSERLAATLLQNAHLGSGEVVQAVRQALQAFTNGRQLRDDITLVAGKLE